AVRREETVCGDELPCAPLEGRGQTLGFDDDPLEVIDVGGHGEAADRQGGERPEGGAGEDEGAPPPLFVEGRQVSPDRARARAEAEAPSLVPFRIGDVDLEALAIGASAFWSRAIRSGTARQPTHGPEIVERGEPVRGQATVELEALGSREAQASVGGALDDVGR